MRRSVALFAALLGRVLAQSCAGYAASSGGVCQCPPGLATSTGCSTLACGNSLLPPAQRPALASTAGNGGCGSGCTSGWAGLNCNVCSSDQACSAAFSTLPSSLQASATASAAVPASTALTGSGDANALTCNTSPYTYTVGYLDCGVVNPTLQAVYPGTTTLLIGKTVRPEYALVGASAYGANGAATAQLFYSANSTAAPVQQFYCAASSCVQTNSTSTGQISYTCANLQCTCVPGTTFCGGSILDISSTINELAGPLDISCDASASGSCSFKQAVLQGLFGASGLGLSGCRAGECARAGVINALQSEANGVSAPASSLSGGVIAGLAVVGAFLLAAVIAVVLGVLRRRRARAMGAAWHKSGRFDESEGMGAASVAWQNLSYVIAPTRSWTGRKSSDHLGGLVVLDDVSGTVPAGGLLAILGPSGAGKSTLVDLLVGKRKCGRMTGHVTIGNGSDDVRVGFVDQDDVLPPMSTVREALMFAATLKLPEYVTKAEKERRVIEVMGQLGLASRADARIGSNERRGLSGGERRRLSIGLELVAQPSVLVLDEPTSGLDSVSAMRVVEILRRLSNGDGPKSEHAPLRRQRTTVIATIHQPSSQIFHSFEQIAVLAKGRQVYFGPASQVVSRLSAAGHPCPAGYNPADFLLELASADQPPSIANEPERPDLKGMRSTSSMSFPPRGQSGSRIARWFRSPSNRPVASALTQFEALSVREMRNLRRDPYLLLAHVGVAIILGVFTGGLFYQVDDSIAGFQSRVGSYFLLGSLTTFASLSALYNVTVIRPLFMRERAAAMYRSEAWLLSRVVWDIVPLRIVPTIILATILWAMAGLVRSAAGYWKLILIAVEFSIVCTLGSFLLAIVFATGGVALLLAAVLNLFQMALAGFFLNVGSIPPVLRWLHWVDPLYYCLEAFTVNEISSGLAIRDTIAGVQVQVSAQLILGLLFGFSPSAYYRDVLVLFAWLAGFGVALAIAVRYLLREMR